MAAPISRDLRAHVPRPQDLEKPAALPARRNRLLRGTQIATILAAIICAGFTASAVHDEDLHLTVAACAWFVMTGIGGSLLVTQSLVCDREEFYRRGQLDGWMRGWRGQEPDVDDPLFK